jgi:hypothetical protein
VGGWPACTLVQWLTVAWCSDMGASCNISQVAQLKLALQRFAGRGTCSPPCANPDLARARCLLISLPHPCLCLCLWPAMLPDVATFQPWSEADDQLLLQLVPTHTQVGRGVVRRDAALAASVAIPPNPVVAAAGDGKP